MSVGHKDIIIGFTVGVLSSITAVILWDLYKAKRGLLEYGEKKMIEELNSAIEGISKENKMMMAKNNS